MNSKLNPIVLDVNGSAIRVLQGGEGGLPLVLFDGAAPGVTVYGAGAHIWGDVLGEFDADASVFAVDGAGSPTFETFDELKNHMAATLGALSLSGCHVVAYDNAGLAAIIVYVNALNERGDEYGFLFNIVRHFAINFADEIEDEFFEVMAMLVHFFVP